MAALDTPNGVAISYTASPAASVDPSFQARPVGEQTGHGKFEAVRQVLVTLCAIILGDLAVFIGAAYTGHCTVAGIALVILCVAPVIAAGAFCWFTWLIAQDLLAYWCL